jgi:iron-chelate-transporting ATPase
VIGRNGAGKSTLLRLLARHIRPAGGRILLDGQDTAAMADRAFARRVAHMAQSAPAIDTLPLRDLVALGRYPWHGALGRRGLQDEAAIDAALMRTGLAGLADRITGTLSGGEQQRARLAMMLAQEADWLILDEPSAALDLAWALEMLGHLRALAAEGKGVVVALHDMNLAAWFCDDLLAVKAGRIVAHGPVAETFRADLLSDLFGAQVEVAEVAGRPVAIAEVRG